MVRTVCGGWKAVSGILRTEIERVPHAGRRVLGLHEVSVFDDDELRRAESWSRMKRYGSGKLKRFGPHKMAAKGKAKRHPRLAKRG